ncbi:MAG: hypothetical protein AB3N06_03245 [Erythrobacter sp.]
MRVLSVLALLLGGCAGEGASDLTDEVATQPEPALSQETAAVARTVACNAGEETVFGCKVASGKRVAVCAGDNGRTYYRFGSDRPELEIEGGAWTHAAYSGGGEAQIAFENAGIRYIVFSRVVRTNFAPGEPNYPAISDGVIVLDGEKVIGLQSCIDPDEVPIDYDLAEKHFPRADELFTFETERADSDE